MSITINGSGSITGLTAGGLPDGSITTDDLAADAVTSAKIANGAIVDADVNASAAIADSKLTGTTCKAWVNFNGSGTVAIRAAYNVSSITDNGTGNYTVNFTTAMADANYALTTMGHTKLSVNTDQRVLGWDEGNIYSTTAVQITNRYYTGDNFSDSPIVSIAIFR